MLDCNLTKCEYIEAIRKDYSTLGLYENTIFNEIIKILLSQQYDFLTELCNSELSKLQIASAAGINLCVPEMIDKGCEDICGSTRRVYAIGNCSDCVYHYDFTDEFLLKVVELKKIRKYPSREILEKITDLFNWDVIYTQESIYIDIKNENPSRIAALLHLLPLPIGVDLMIIGDC